MQDIYFKIMAKIKVRFTSLLVEKRLQAGDVSKSTEIMKGIPEDAKLIDASIIYPSRDLELTFETEALRKYKDGEMIEIRLKKIK